LSPCPNFSYIYRLGFGCQLWKNERRWLVGEKKFSLFFLLSLLPNMKLELKKAKKFLSLTKSSFSFELDVD